MSWETNHVDPDKEALFFRSTLCLCSPGPPPRLDGHGRPASDREAWRDRDRGYGSRPYPPVASRSAAIASYAGRPGPGGGKRPDDPERVRRTVFVDNVEITYDEEVRRLGPIDWHHCQLVQHVTCTSAVQERLGHM